MAVPQIGKKKKSLDDPESPLEYITKRIENKASKRYLYTYVYSSIIHSSSNVSIYR